MGDLGRRSFLRALGVGTIASAGLAVAGCSGGGQSAAPVATTLTVTPTPTPTPDPALWPGHQPGCVLLGASAGRDLEATFAATGALTATRRFYAWYDAEREAADIAADHAAGRVPWVSFKPATKGPGGWAEITSGVYDQDIRDRAMRYAGFTQPVIATFHHEPHDDPEGEPQEFSKAWRHIHDVMEETTTLTNCAFVPIVGESAFDKTDYRERPDSYLRPMVLERSAFLGVDIYQNRSGQAGGDRLARVLAWLDDEGHSDMMIGLGEVGASDFWGRPTGATWWTELWSWATSTSDRVGIVSYFNSVANNHSEADWRLEESPDKLEAFRTSALEARTCAPA
jgi:hypothetical protein